MVLGGFYNLFVCVFVIALRFLFYLGGLAGSGFLPFPMFGGSVAPLPSSPTPNPGVPFPVIIPGDPTSFSTTTSTSSFPEPPPNFWADAHTPKNYLKCMFSASRQGVQGVPSQDKKRQSQWGDSGFLSDEEAGVTSSSQIMGGDDDEGGGVFGMIRGIFDIFRDD